MSDTGDVKKPTQPGAVMQWEVGCGNVNANHMPILQQLEATSSDSTKSKAVGHGIIGWHVTNNKPHTHQRIKVKLQINNVVNVNGNQRYKYNER